MDFLCTFLYINDLCFATASSSLYTQFADDTAASVCGKSLDELQMNISHAYSRILKRFDDNKHVLHKKKN